jgi:exodeoxyribonuclease-1
MVTGISPQIARERGVTEVEFIQQIRDEMMVPNSCSVGYNSIRFDDEATRNTLYRNLYDPYEREYKNGNSRWDIIDLVRTARALRPDGIEWPMYDDGKPSMRLEHLTVANGIEHGDAHDALSDVYATIAMAKLIKDKQPKLYDFILTNSKKQEVEKMLNLQNPTPLIHISSMFSSQRSNLAIIYPVARHPTNPNAVIVYDLLEDPTPLLTLSIEDIHARLFVKSSDLPDGVSRIPLKSIHLNKCPVVAPLNTLSLEVQERLGVDLKQQLAHAEELKNSPYLAEKVVKVHNLREFPAENDPDKMIYSGNFFSSSDRGIMNHIHTLSPAELALKSFHFEDPRLETMLFRYRARNWPESLNEDEQLKWDRFCQHRILDKDGGGSTYYEEYCSKIIQLKEEHTGNSDKIKLLDELISYGNQLAQQ